jgi:Fe-S-cluster containining protein
MAVTIKIQTPAPEPGNGKPETQNMCHGCPGHCCKLLVDLTSYDIFRLIVLSEKNFGDFAEVAYAKPDDAYGFRALGVIVKLVLRHKDNGYCVLFNEKNGLGCTVEESKPAICLTYPFVINGGRREFQARALCPPKNRLKADYAKMSPQVFDDAFWEFDRYQEIINDWNLAADGSELPGDFLAFAASEMELEKTRLGRIIRTLKRSIRKLKSSL